MLPSSPFPSPSGRTHPTRNNSRRRFKQQPAAAGSPSSPAGVVAAATGRSFPPLTPPDLAATAATGSAARGRGEGMWAARVSRREGGEARGVIRSGGGGKRPGRRFGGDERASARSTAHSVGRSLSHRQAIAFLCLDYCVQQSCPHDRALPHRWPPPPLNRSGDVQWGKMGAMWWNGAGVKYDLRGREGSSFLTFSPRASSGEIGRAAGSRLAPTAEAQCSHSHSPLPGHCQRPLW